MVPSTVLIAASDHLAALQQHDDFSDAEAFPDTDALKALEAITRQRPSVVVLEKPFALTARGTALINRIKADPALASCEIRILDVDGGQSRGVTRSPDGPAAATAVAVAPPPARSEERDTRRAPRVVISRDIAVLIDGNPATLVNISVVGAQVTSSLALRPNQRVRMSLEEAERPVRFNGVVAWASFEMPKEGPRYRAGINFYDASPEMVARFIDTITA
jgi:hypothetical protein